MHIQNHSYPNRLARLAAVSMDLAGGWDLCLPDRAPLCCRHGGLPVANRTAARCAKSPRNLKIRQRPALRADPSTGSGRRFPVQQAFVLLQASGRADLEPQALLQAVRIAQALQGAQALQMAQALPVDLVARPAVGPVWPLPGHVVLVGVLAPA